MKEDFDIEEFEDWNMQNSEMLSEGFPYTAENGKKYYVTLTCERDEEDDIIITIEIEEMKDGGKK